MRRFTFLWVICILLSACGGGSKEQFNNLPIEIKTESQLVRIDDVINNAQTEVQKSLPDAYLVFFSFVGECGDLPILQGEIRLDFAHIQQSLFGDRTILAETTINTTAQTLSYTTKDETEHYPNLDSLVINGKGIQEIASILHNYLASKNSCTDTVVLTRVRTESPWRVRCGHPEEVLLECIEIDPITGKITELK